MKKIFNSKTVVRSVFFTLLASVIYVAIRLVLAPSGAGVPDQDVRVKSDYALMLLQCVMGMGVMLLPGILQRKLKITIPSGMLVAFAIFLFCGVYLGKCAISTSASRTGTRCCILSAGSRWAPSACP